MRNFFPPNAHSVQNAFELDGIDARLIALLQDDTLRVRTSLVMDQVMPDFQRR